MTDESPGIKIPNEVEEIFSRFIAAEYAYFTPKGEPLCWPVTPYWDTARRALGIATGLAYPNKAEYAKRNPKVALLFSDPTSSGLEGVRPVLVQGDAKVQDDDIQQNTDRYVTELRKKFGAARLGLNPLTVKLLDFYLPRLWVEITPKRLTDPHLESENLHVSRVQDIDASMTHGRLREDELAALRRVFAENESAVLTTKASDGYPYPRRITVKVSSDDSIQLGQPAFGPACLTIHRHALGGVRFQAYLVRGYADGTLFIPTRLAGFFGNGFVFPFSVVPHVTRLRRNLKSELKKRGKPMPKLRVPNWKIL